jgi:hypothetical protein
VRGRERWVASLARWENGWLQVSCNASAGRTPTPARAERQHHQSTFSIPDPTATGAASSPARPDASTVPRATRQAPKPHADTRPVARREPRQSSPRRLVYIDPSTPAPAGRRPVPTPAIEESVGSVAASYLAVCFLREILRPFTMEFLSAVF